jgi:hypothetical protein
VSHTRINLYNLQKLGNVHNWIKTLTRNYQPAGDSSSSERLEAGFALQLAGPRIGTLYASLAGFQKHRGLNRPHHPRDRVTLTDVGDVLQRSRAVQAGIAPDQIDHFADEPLRQQFLPQEVEDTIGELPA